MAKTNKEIVRDLLKEANYYWYDDNEDNVRPLNPEDYDPVVDKIFKANAVELEKLYAEMGESQREVILGLSKSLVPDQSLLPEPGYTVAQVNPKASRVYTSPEDKYLISGQSDTGEKYDYYFTPMFEHEYPKCALVAILTENSAIQIEDNLPEVVKEIPGAKASSSIWLGLNIGKAGEKDSIPFFLGNRIVDEFDKDYHVFHAAKWFLNGKAEQKLSVNNGVESFGSAQVNGKSGQLLDILNVPNTYEKQIFSRLRNSFILLGLPPDIDDFKYKTPPLPDEHELTSALNIKQPLCWIKLEFPLAISNDFFLENMLYPNCIPLVNRRLKENYVVKSNYDRILLPMPTSDFFLDVHKVQDSRNKEDGSSYQKVDFLHPDSRPGTFTVRSGTRIRRMNREDASRQIHRLMEVIQDEYSTFKEEGVNRLREDFDVIEKAINRIKSQLPDYFRTQEVKSTYFGIANFRSSVSRLYYQYWETQGDEIEQLGDKIGLEVTSSDRKIAGSRSVIPIQKGKGELSSDDFINQLKISLLSRGRIMTKGDIELYCKSRYGHLLEVKTIKRELMMVEDGKRARGILVTVRLTKHLSRAEADFIRIELQNDLNAKSAFFTHIKVEVAHEA